MREGKEEKEQHRPVKNQGNSMETKMKSFTKSKQMKTLSGDNRKIRGNG
jgi:hypothetical protein